MESKGTKNSGVTTYLLQLLQERDEKIDRLQAKIESLEKELSSHTMRPAGRVVDFKLKAIPGGRAE